MSCANFTEVAVNCQHICEFTCEPDQTKNYQNLLTKKHTVSELCIPGGRRKHQLIWPVKRVNATKLGHASQVLVKLGNERSTYVTDNFFSKKTYLCDRTLKNRFILFSKLNGVQ